MNSGVIAYLHYLRDISRKIVGKTGFNNLIAPATKKAQGLVRQLFTLDHKIQPSDPQYDYLSEVIRVLDRQADRQFFIGFGLFAGKYQRKSYSAPLLFMECMVERETDTGVICLDPDYSSLRLNYDLLADVAGFEIFQEEQDIEIIGERELEAFEFIENQIRHWFDRSELPAEVLRHYAETNWQQKIPTQPPAYFLGEFLQRYATAVFHYFQGHLAGLKGVSEYHGGYRWEDEWQQKQMKSKTKALSIYENPLTYVQAMHGFVAPVPDELSTHQALQALADTVDEQGIENRTISQLLSGVLYGSAFEPRTYLESHLQSALDHLPFSLSEPQIKGIINAFTQDISYIQGPPGTGKSHTITAILCASVLMGKSVLFVSQKTAALNVVDEKMRRLFPEEIAPHIPMYFDKDARPNLKLQAKKLLEISSFHASDTNIYHDLKDQLESLRENLDHLLTEKRRIEKDLHEKQKLQQQFISLHQSRNETYRHIQQKYKVPLPEINILPTVKSMTTLQRVVSRMTEWENERMTNLITRLHQKKLFYQLQTQFYAPENTVSQHGFKFVADWSQMLVAHTKAENHQSVLKDDYEILSYELIHLKNKILQLQTEYLHLQAKIHFRKIFQDKQIRQAVDKWEKMLYWRKPSVIREKMSGIDYAKLLQAFPIWSCEIRYAGQIFPTLPEMFDLVVVDEASQVNLAEILPIFYRAKRVCVVGDHAQLSLQSTGVNFKLSRRFDVLTWMQYKPADKDYTYAKEAHLTVTDASILDFLRSPHAGFRLPQVRLQAHYRSLPALAQYTARFYEDFTVMTETPERLHLPSFREIPVTGKRTAEKTIPEEAQEIIKIIEDIVNKHFILIPELRQHGPQNITIGILSLIRSQCDLLTEMLTEKFSSEIWQKTELMIGTPEEFQGNERDVMILSLTLDADQRHSRGHYENPNRWNVATSRAKIMTIAVHAGIPENFEGLKSWLRHFKQYSPPIQHFKDERQHELMNVVAEYLQKFIAQINDDWVLWSSPKLCGQKDLHLILQHQGHKKGMLIEILGLEPEKHTSETSLYQKHQILFQAGWKIRTTLAHQWYERGIILPFENPFVQQTIRQWFADD
jgi:hypothetical protein